MQYGSARDRYMAQAGTDQDQMIAELEEKLNEGMSLEDAIRTVGASGQYDVTELQRVAFKVGNPDYDPAAMTPPGESETKISGPGEGGFKPFEDVARDLTNPQDEFDKALAQFTRQLETSQKGQAPNIAVLTERRFDLFNKYLGEIEARKTRGEEAPNVFKEEFLNIGKSTISAVRSDHGPYATADGAAHAVRLRLPDEERRSGGRLLLDAVRSASRPSAAGRVPRVRSKIECVTCDIHPRLA